MPVQTRAAGQPQAAKVHKAAAPEPKQQRFPARRRHIKTYGRRTAPKRLDQTLTQMNFVSATAPEEPQILSSSSDDEEEQKVEPVKKAAKRQPAQKASRSSRRRTTGDAADEDELEKPQGNKRRKTLGDPPSASSSFYTQTLTQFLSVSNTDEDDWKIPGSDSEDGIGLGLVKETPKKQKREDSLDDKRSKLPKPVSVTPANRKTKLEIPSSQSPATPLLLRYSPAKEPSPLKDKSTNISASQSVRKSVGKTPRHFVIQDSYSTSHSSPITPTPKAKTDAVAQGTVTPAKRLRFDLPGNKENITPGRTKPKSPKLAVPRSSQRQPLSEVPDSDDDFEAETEEDVSAAATPTRLSKSASKTDDVVVSSSLHETEDFTISVDKDADEEDEDEEAGERYVAGEETQALLISSGNPSSLELGSRSIRKAATHKHQSPQRHDNDDDDQVVSVTPTNRHKADEIIEQTPTRPRPGKPAEDAATSRDELDTQAYTQGYTQGMESQRVPLETIKATGPISDRSDIIISIYNVHVKNMAKRTKTHEFRDWKFPESVHRVWIYIPRPVSELKYMCTFGQPKVAGEIGEEGIGNVEFNRGMKRSKFAHEVINMYELNNPVSLQTMRQNGWPTAPQKFSYVPPAVVGQLTANLRCALWGEDAEQDIVHSSPNVTESQELAEQIRSDISHATQLESSDAPEVVPSSQSPPRSLRSRKTPGKGGDFARPALPTTFSASSVRSLPAPRSETSHGAMRPSQASTISQLSSSSPMPSPEKSMALPPMVGTVRPGPSQVPETSSPSANRYSHHSLRSSQFPTKSQMLPDSLLNGDIEEPPPIIWDSADEDSD